MFRVVMAARGAGTSLVTAARVGAQVAVRATHRSAYCVPLVATVSSDGRFGRIAAGMAAVVTTATAAVVGLELFPLKAECEAGAYPVYLAAPISPDLAQVRLDDPGVTIRPISHVTYVSPLTRSRSQSRHSHLEDQPPTHSYTPTLNCILHPLLIHSDTHVSTHTQRPNSNFAMHTSAPRSVGPTPPTGRPEWRTWCSRSRPRSSLYCPNSMAVHSSRLTGTKDPMGRVAASRQCCKTRKSLKRLA